MFAAKRSGPVRWLPALAFLILPLTAQAAPQLSLSTTKISFGRVPQHQVFKQEIVMSNHGDEDLVLSEVYTSCSCTELALRETTVPPGGSTVLDVTFHSRDLSGENNKLIEITCNDPLKSLVEIPLLAFVAAPILVEPSDRVLDFGVVKRGAAPSLEAKLKADDRASLNVALLDEDLSATAEHFSASISAGPTPDRATLRLQLEPNAIAGPFRQVLRLRTDDERMPLLDFTVSGNVLGELGTSPGRVNFRFVKPGQSLSKEIAVSAKSPDLRFRVTGGSVDLPGLSVEILADGSQGEARLRVAGTALAADDSLALASQGRIKSHLHIYTDRADEPELLVDLLYMLR